MVGSIPASPSIKGIIFWHTCKSHSVLSEIKSNPTTSRADKQKPRSAFFMFKIMNHNTTVKVNTIDFRGFITEKVSDTIISETKFNNLWNRKGQFSCSKSEGFGRTIECVHIFDNVERCCYAINDGAKCFVRVIEYYK